MTSGDGRQVRADTKSERIVEMTEQGIPQKEIARLLHTTIGSVKVLLWKRRHLTRKLKANSEELPS